MTSVSAQEITEKIAEECIRINCRLSEDMEGAVRRAAEQEVSPIGRNVFSMVCQNMDLAGEHHRPICQDTGMVVAFVTLGQDVRITGGSLEDAVQSGVRQGYGEGYLRKSVVSDPILRVNTGDNTPAVIHYQVVPGDALEILLMPKGFGSENTSALKMLKPSDGAEGVMDFVLDTIEKGAPNACAPIVVGVGIGGTFEKAAIMAKRALALPVDNHNAKAHLREMEERLVFEANNLGIGPMGLGGTQTVLGVHILDYPTHIAGLPVAVNICCYVNRHGKVVFS